MTKISHILWGGYDKGFYGNTSSNVLKKLFDLGMLDSLKVLVSFEL